MRRRRIGIDVGGTGIKGAVVDLGAGAQHPEEYQATPAPATPDAVAAAVAGMVAPWDCRGRLGIALPFTVEDGIARTAGNISPEWIGTNAGPVRGGAGRNVVVLNDTDAAGIAEARYGAAAIRGRCWSSPSAPGSAARFCAAGSWSRTPSSASCTSTVSRGRVRLASALRSERLPWPEWIGRANRFLRVVEEHDHYDLIVIGGGVTHEAEHWEGQLVTRAPLRRARFFNRAGVIGAAIAAEHGIHEVFRRVGAAR